MTAAKPASRPNVPHFSSGPCAKRPGWTPQNLKDAALGRSHRANIGKEKLTGAIEMALWSLLGARPVTTLSWESFGEGWTSDILNQLELKDVTKLAAAYGD